MILEILEKYPHKRRKCLPGIFRDPSLSFDPAAVCMMNVYQIDHAYDHFF